MSEKVAVRRILIDWREEEITVVYSHRTYYFRNITVSLMNLVQGVKNTWPGTEQNYGANSAYNDAGSKSYAYRYTEWIAGIECNPLPQQPEEFEFVTLTVLPDLKLEIKLNENGKEQLDYYLKKECPGADRYDYFTPTLVPELEMLEAAYCNGWTLDPDDDGRTFISKTGYDDDGNPDYQPSELGWYWNYHAIRSWVEDLYDNGKVVFSCYSFGIDSLDNQRTLVY